MNSLNSNDHASVLEQYKAESPAMAEFRRMYAKIRHLNEDKRLKNFMVTSAELGEGKSTVSALSAITISKYQNTKTLLIDADLRRPMIHKLFNLEQNDGIAEVLSGTNPLKNSFKKTEEENLDLLTAGKVKEAPAELFNTNMTIEIFEECKFYYNTIIIDAPPVIPVSDTIVIGSQMDGILLVVKAGKTKKEIVKRAKELLVDSGINILGVILNNFGEVLPYYYDYKYYGYQYYHSSDNGLY